MVEHAFQILGDQLTKALLSNNFAMYRALMTLPVTFTPTEGKAYTLHTDAELEADFDLYVSIIKLHGVTDIYRRFIGISPEADGELSVHVITHILVRANLLAEPFASRMRLRKVEGAWRITEIESTKGHLNWTLGLATVLPDGRFELKED
jgi:hypothetical protein